MSDAEPQKITGPEVQGTNLDRNHVVQVPQLDAEGHCLRGFPRGDKCDI